MPLALLFFNLGVELGQLAFRGGPARGGSDLAQAHAPWPRWTAALPAYAIGSLAMFWTMERIAAFWA